MKPTIHPKFYNNTKVSCACGNVFVTGSTLEDLKTEICSNCHPFYTGKQKLIDATGSVDRFKKRSALAIKLKSEAKNLAHYESLGKLYQEQRNFTDSRDIFLYLVKHDSDNSEYHAKLAYACYQLKEYETSIKHYQKSLALDSSHPNRYYNLGLGLKHLKRYAESRLALQKAVEMESGNAKYKEALASLKK